MDIRRAGLSAGKLTGYIEDVTAADGYAYDPKDNVGHGISGGKILESPNGNGFLAVYGYWDELTQEFRVHVGTSADLLHWTWRVELARQASQPTIRAASDGGFVVGWEQEPDNHMKFAYFPTLTDLLSNQPTKTFEPPRQLSTCAEGTPSLYSASSTALDVGFHFFRGCEVDRQARGTTDWTSWTSSAQPHLDVAMEAHGVRGGIGDRDGPFSFRGHDFMLFEGMAEPDHWETFRVFLYDSEIGSSLRLDMRTHAGSLNFTNPTISQVALGGRAAIVVSMFIPMETGADPEIGGVIYYRFISDE
ncbi:MAG: hypothetical protein WD830_03870 [Chloroflexota bacterium]